nr:immunoglobulin heavy chain junction region [Macaca mulatta]MPN83936.1 immunoglobulin heavy chain junction region [Macaca mulatta]MPN83955.1 immunoglobulin heavy chain junction region [Macaca mulatta]MPN83987.1 immunoglobulin heavy chain junction region [Macaca mulatta]MPN84010.1 immunoglobulin heavy chain junction region [Macaca mulatta]
CARDGGSYYDGLDSW